MASGLWLERTMALPLFEGLEEACRKPIAELLLRLSREMTLDDGEQLIQEGALGGTAGFILMAGQVLVERSGAAPITVCAPALLGEMQQFNPQSLRTASVCAQGEAVVLRFGWQELYAQARLELEETIQGLLLGAIERCVWERFHEGALLDLPLLRRLPDQLRLQIALMLHWVAQPVFFEPGETLFRSGELCGSHGFLLLTGSVNLGGRGQVNAPALLGILPQFEPDLTWRATATAETAVSGLKFNWQALNLLIEQRLAPATRALFDAAVAAARVQEFCH